MSVYMIFSFNVVDPVGFARYGAIAQPLLAKYGAEILAADFSGEALEGTSRGANVIIRFPSKAHATAFYSDPDYAPGRALRMATTAEQHLVLVSSFSLPR